MMMTNETTPDAVELLSALLGEMLDGLVVPPTEAIERRERLYRARNALLAERARHAEEVAEERRLKELKRQETVSLQGAVRKLMDQLEAEEARVASLREQLRKVTAERDDARAQVAEVQHEHDALLQRADQAERELGAWQDWALTHCDPGDGSDDKHLRELVGSQLTSLRSLLPDARACAERCRDTLIGPPGMPVEDYPLAPVALAARRILAVLDSQGGEGE